MSRKQVDIATPDGVADSYIFIPEGKGPFPAVLFYMDGGGLRPDIHDMAQRLADNGYYVLLPNLFYRAGRAETLDVQAAFADPERRDQAMAMIMALTNTVVMRDTAAFFDFLSRQPEADARKIGCHGYCMGGKLALSAAGTFPDRVVAAASFHGSQLATDASDSAHLLAPKMRGKVYVGVAGIDPWLLPGETVKLREALQAAKTDFVMEDYSTATHGFCVPGPVYDREAAERHWERLLKLYETTLI
jgi:carboxymethylenebutenolidase